MCGREAGPVGAPREREGWRLPGAWRVRLVLVGEPRGGHRVTGVVGTRPNYHCYSLVSREPTQVGDRGIRPMVIHGFPQQARIHATQSTTGEQNFGYRQVDPVDTDRASSD